MPVRGDDLGTRMKEFYEKPYQTKLTRRTPVAIRIDGKEPDWSKVTRTLTPTGGDDITATNISYTDNGTIKTGNKVVGKRYTLTLSNLEQLQTKDISGNYIEYSGVVSVVIPQNKVADIGTTGDKTNLNKNIDKSWCFLYRLEYVFVS